MYTFKQTLTTLEFCLPIKYMKTQKFYWFYNTTFRTFQAGLEHHAAMS